MQVKSVTAGSLLATCGQDGQRERNSSAVGFLGSSNSLHVSAQYLKMCLIGNWICITHIIVNRWILDTISASSKRSQMQNMAATVCAALLCDKEAIPKEQAYYGKLKCLKNMYHKLWVYVRHQYLTDILSTPALTGHSEASRVSHSLWLHGQCCTRDEPLALWHESEEPDCHHVTMWPLFTNRGVIYSIYNNFAIIVLN